MNCPTKTFCAHLRRLRNYFGINSLSGRLLLLTGLFVLMSEFFVTVPSIGRFYYYYMLRHVHSAELVVMPLDSQARNHMTADLRQMLLDHANALAIYLRHPDRRELYLSSEPKNPLRHKTYKIDKVVYVGPDPETHELTNIINGFDCLLSGGHRLLFVKSLTQINGAQEIDLVLDDAPLHRELIAFIHSLMRMTLFVAILSAFLVYASMYFLLARPMQRIIQTMRAFRQNPEDATRFTPISRRHGEIGETERELATMQREVYGYLRQKARLAAVGEAVARIQHDLRNILAAAQLASERLIHSEDPTVKALAPGLVAAIDRAVELSSRTLEFGRTEEHLPDRTRFDLRELIDEVFRNSGAPQGIQLHNSVLAHTAIFADREQMFRVFLNLIRNAIQAFSNTPEPVITISAWHDGNNFEIDVFDNGSGIPDYFREKLFKPFAIISSHGGSGLGLAIVRELVKGHGGHIRLMASGPQGTRFRITLPAATI